MEKVTLSDLRGSMSQRKLAEILGLKPSTISMYETGARVPSLKTALLIAEYFSVPVETIIFGRIAYAS